MIQLQPRNRTASFVTGAQVICLALLLSLEEHHPEIPIKKLLVVVFKSDWTRQERYAILNAPLAPRTNPFEAPPNLETCPIWSLAQ